MDSKPKKPPTHQSFYQCSFPYCGYKGTSGLFKFPSDPLIRSKWINVCCIENISQSTKICFKHFKEIDVFKGPKLWRIRATAIPSWWRVCSIVLYVIILGTYFLLQIFRRINALFFHKTLSMNIWIFN